MSEDKDKVEKTKDGEVDDGKDEQDELDIEAESIMKDKAAVKKLLLTKRSANEEAKKRRLNEEKLQKEKDDAEKKRLQDEGKFKELADKAEVRAKDAEARHVKVTINAALKVAALQAGIQDPADAVALCDRSALKVEDDGETVTGAAEAVEALKKSKPYLFGQGGDNGQDGKQKVPAPGDKKPITRTTPQTFDGPVDPVERINAGLEKAARKG